MRRIAREAGLPNHEEGLDRHLLHRRAAVPRVSEPLPAEGTGRIVDEGQYRREHIGLAFYTIGQRKGIGIGGKEAWYVAAKR